MAVIIKDSEPVIITEPKTLSFDLPKKVNNKLEHEIDFIIKRNKFSIEEMK